MAWATLVLGSSLAGGVWFAYIYATDSDTLARMIRAAAPRFLPGGVVDVGRVRVRPFAGEVQVTQLTLRQSVDGRALEALRVPWLSLRHDPRALLDGRFAPTEIVVAQPTLRLCRRRDGSWNLQGLCASPWPAGGAPLPPTLIQNGTVELVTPHPDVDADADAGPPATAAILREVSLKVESAGPGKLAFDGTAKGDTFDRVSLRGTVDLVTGRVDLGGEVARLVLSDTLRARLPEEVRPAVAAFGLNSGEVDVRVNSVEFDPAASPRLRYDVSGRLISGVWNCAKLPFPLNDLSTAFAVRDGVLTLERAEGYYGGTTVRVEHAEVDLAEPDVRPFTVAMDVIDLELEPRLRERTPAAYAGLWRAFSPRGRVTVSLRASRAERGGPVRRRVAVVCDDVAMMFEHFKYPFDHVRGRFVWEADRVTVERLHTLVGGQPLSVTGTIDAPGPRASASLAFTFGALPVDATLRDALPDDVRAVVDQFSPSGTVRGTVRVTRTPPAPGEPPKGTVAVDAYLDLNERCSITWANLPYPVNNLTGRLEIHPDRWEFQNMRGVNGQAEIKGSGRVVRLPGPDKRLDVDLRLTAEKLPFDDQLRASLPPAWQKSWATLDPTGSSDVDATIRVHHGERPSYVLVVAPRPATDVRLTYTRDPKPGDPGGRFELRFQDVTGRFVFNNGPVDMADVGFRFHGAPVRFARGRVVVEDSGKFELGVRDVWARDVRVDSQLRAVMPPVMAQFAQRIDDGRTFTLRGDLALDWSGRADQTVRCAWDNALVVLNDNSVVLQPGLSLEHLQGELNHVRGRADGETFEVHGVMQLESVSLLGQQITRLESPIDVERGVARLDSLRGFLLGGELTGKLGVSLDATPRYAASLALRGADLQRYAETQRGRQTFRGAVHARLDLTGAGGDVRALQGSGEAHIAQGDLGELPVFLRLVKVLNLSSATKTAFDAADVSFTVQNGKTYLDPIRFTGNAFSLLGGGTMDPQGDLDLRLQVIYGRDKLHLRGLSDALRMAGGQFATVRVLGTPSFPKFKLELLPEASDVLRSLGQRRAERAEERRK